MAATQSFDVTTGCDLQEVDNAVNQSRKEIAQRYDFRGVKAEIEFRRSDNKIVLQAPDDYKMKAVYEVLRTKLIRRKVPLKNLTEGAIQPAAGATVSQEISLQQGIPTETAKSIVKFIKEKKMKKVQAAIQQEQVRVSSPSRDSLQEVMGMLKEHDFGIELRFENYRSQ
jgi:cyclic-di-GMP-binding protein